MSSSQSSDQTRCAFRKISELLVKTKYLAYGVDQSFPFEFAKERTEVALLPKNEGVPSCVN